MSQEADVVKSTIDDKQKAVSVNSKGHSDADGIHVYLEQLVTRLDEYEDEIQRLRTVNELHDRDKSVEFDLRSLAESQSEKVSAELMEARQHIQELGSELAGRAEHEASLCREIRVYEEELAGSTEKEADLNQKIDAYRDEIQLLRAQCASQTQNSDENFNIPNNEAQELRDALSKREEKMTKQVKRIKSLKKDVRTLREAFNNLAESAGIEYPGQTPLGREEMVKELEQSSLACISFDSEELEEEILKEKDGEIINLKERIAKLTRFLSHIKKSKGSLAEELKEVKLIHQHLIETNELKLKTVQNEKQQLSSNISKVTDQLCECEGQLRSQSKEIERLNSILGEHRETSGNAQIALTESRISTNTYKAGLENSSRKIRCMASLAMRQKVRIVDLERLLGEAKQAEVSLQSERRRINEQKEISLTTQAMNEVYKEESRLLQKKLNAFLPPPVPRAGGVGTSDLYELNEMSATNFDAILQGRNQTIEDILKM